MRTLNPNNLERMETISPNIRRRTAQMSVDGLVDMCNRKKADLRSSSGASKRKTDKKNVRGKIFLQKSFSLSFFILKTEKIIAISFE